MSRFPDQARRARVVRRGSRLALLGLLALVTAGCLGARDVPSVSFPAQTFGTGSVSGATAATRAAIVAALSADGLRVADPLVPYRPAESPAFTSAPRQVIQVLLPADPDHGYISIYEFPDPAAAQAAAVEQAAYVGSAIGRVQFPPDTRFVIRVAGSTVIFHAWSPANATDPGATRIPIDLATIGIGVDIPG